MRSASSRLPSDGYRDFAPADAASFASEAHGPVSIPDAARRCRRIAADIGATDYAVFLIGPSAERGRLVPCFDSEYPGIAATTKLLPACFSDDIVRQAHASTAPFWWATNRQSASAASFEKLEWAVETDAYLPGTSGLGFPVHADRGQSGLVLFLGTAIAVDNLSLCDVHARCFTLFAAVARLRSIESGRMPAVSRRELECLKLTANGHTSEEIAARLKLSVHTANQYLTNAVQKLNAVNRMHAVAKALRLGLIE